MSQIITPDNPDPQPEPELKQVMYNQLLAVVLNKLAPAGIVLTPEDIQPFVNGEMLLMQAITKDGIDLKVITKEEAEVIKKNGQQVGHA